MANFDGFPPVADLVSPSYITVQNDGVWDRGGSFTVEFAREKRVRLNANGQGESWARTQYSDFSPVTPYSLFQFGTGRTLSYNVFRVLRSQSYVVIDLDQAAYEYTDPREESINDISWLVAPGFTCTQVEQVLGDNKFLIGDDKAPGTTTEHIRQDVLTAHFSVDSSVAAGIYELAYKTWVREVYINTVLQTSVTTHYERKSERIFISVGFSNVFPAPRTGIIREDAVWDEENEQWIDIDEVGTGDGEGEGFGFSGSLSALGGGRYNEHIVTLSDRGQIYFGSTT